jgi:hypothetical protein
MKTVDDFNQRHIDREVSFIRLAFYNYPTAVERMFKRVTKEEKTSWLPRKCAISRKPLFLKKAIRVTLTDTLQYKKQIKTRWYDSQEFMLTVIKL